MSSLADRYAHQFLEARAHSKVLTPLSAEMAFTTEDAYEIAKSLDSIRIAEGDRVIGRKLGPGLGHPQSGLASNPAQAQETLFWTSLFASTVRTLDASFTIQSLKGALQPKLEPLMVFKLSRTPTAEATLDALADSLEWMAHGVEIAVNPYGEQTFSIADAIAAFGMHGTLLIGERRMLSSATRHHMAAILSDASVSLSCDETLLSAGYGSNVLGNPLHALWQLHQQLNAQTQFPPLHAGEIISTGAWTKAYQVQAGQTWSTAFSGISLAGLTVSFV